MGARVAARAAFRNNNNPNNRNNNNGVRLCGGGHVFICFRWRRPPGLLRVGLSVTTAIGFRHCPPTPVCGPRRSSKDGAGESRPHGLSRRAYIKSGRLLATIALGRPTLFLVTLDNSIRGKKKSSYFVVTGNPTQGKKNITSTALRRYALLNGRAGRTATRFQWSVGQELMGPPPHNRTPQL